MWTWEERSAKSGWYSVQHASGFIDAGSVHMVPIHEKNLELFENSEFENIKGLFGITRLMIEGNSEIKNVLPADVASSLWEKPVLLKEQAIRWTKARVYVYSDTVSCLGKFHGPEDAIRRWNDQVSTLKMCPTFRELQGLDGDPIDFEWKIFPEALYIRHKIQADLQGKNITPQKFSDRIIFMSMFNDIELGRKDNEDSCALTSRKIKEYASKVNDGHWAFLGPGDESNWYQGYAAEYGGKWDLRASQMLEILRIPDIRYSRG